MSDRAYALFEEQQQARGINLDEVKARLKALKIETPSWGYGDSGTRFKVFQKELQSFIRYLHVSIYIRIWNNLSDFLPSTDLLDNFC